MIARRLPCLALLLVAGCSPPASRDPDAPRAPDEAALNEQIAGDMTAIRLTAAEKRIVQLEQQVGELQAKPEKLDLQLITQRLETLEARVYAGNVPPAPTPTPTPRSAGRRTEPQPGASPAPHRFNPFGL